MVLHLNSSPKWRVRLGIDKPFCEMLFVCFFMHLYNHRLDSFKSRDQTGKKKKAWPYKSKVKLLHPSYLANVGFYHTPESGKLDCLTCFACLKVCDWSATADHPLNYHLDNDPCWNIKLWGQVCKARQQLPNLNVNINRNEYNAALLKSFQENPVSWPFPTGTHPDYQEVLYK
jgi:hypothetical protein